MLSGSADIVLLSEVSFKVTLCVPSQGQGGAACYGRFVWIDFSEMNAGAPSHWRMACLNEVR